MADITPDPDLDDWALIQPAEATGDPIWRLAAFRNAAYLLTLARDDAAALSRDPLRGRGRGATPQVRRLHRRERRRRLRPADRSGPDPLLLVRARLGSRDRGLVRSVLRRTPCCVAQRARRRPR